MEFEHFEYKFSSEGAGVGRRIASLLAEQGYQSLHREAVDLVRRYLPGGAGAEPADPPAHAATVDVLIPPATPAVRILVCERPAIGAPGSATVAVVAVGRSLDEAHRSRTAAKLALDSKGNGDNELAGHLTADNGRARASRFAPEWAQALGLTHPDAPGTPSLSTPRPLASAQALFTLQGAQPLLGRPAVLRSRLDKSGNGTHVDPAVLDGLVAEGLVERSFVLMCRESGQVVGIGKDAAEVQAAMQLAIRCPHCRRPLSDESQDVVYSLSTPGEEFIRSTHWMRDALESSLRKRHCEAVLLDGAADGRLDGAACYKDAVLLFRLKDGAAADDDVRMLLQASAEFAHVAPGVPTRSAIVTTQPAAPAAGGNGNPPCVVLDASRLDEGLDRLLEDVKREAFARLTGTMLQFARPDPGTLLSRTPA